MTATAIVQARMGSTRLPGKSLSSLGPTTVLGAVLSRLERAESVTQIIVATTDEPADDPLAGSAEAQRHQVVRGSTHDVLARFLKATELATSDTLLRVTGDCPFLDPSIVDTAVKTLVETGADYVGTDIDGRFPHGLDVEALTKAALLRSVEFATEASDREHVTPALYRTGQFHVERIMPPDWAQRPDIRLTVDEEEDLALARALLALEPRTLELSAQEIIALLDDNPELKQLNSDVTHNTSPVEGFQVGESD